MSALLLSVFHSTRDHAVPGTHETPNAEPELFRVIDERSSP